MRVSYGFGFWYPGDGEPDLFYEDVYDVTGLLRVNMGASIVAILA